MVSPSTRKRNSHSTASNFTARFVLTRMCDGPRIDRSSTNSWRARGRRVEEGQISRGVHAIPADVSADCRRGNETTTTRTRYCGPPCITTDDIKSPLSLSTAYHGAINPRETHDIIAKQTRTRSLVISALSSSLCRSGTPDVFVDVVKQSEVLFRPCTSARGQMCV